MFGGLEGDQEWGGREALDSDVDMPELPPVQISLSSESSPLKEEPDLVPAAEDAQGNSGSEESPAGTPTPVSERALASLTTQNEDTKAKLRDLFAPQEEQSEPPLPRSSNISDLRPVGFSLLNHSISTWNSRTKNPSPLLPFPRPHLWQSSRRRSPRVHPHGYHFLTLKSRSTRPSPCSSLSRPTKEQIGGGTQNSRI